VNARPRLAGVCLALGAGLILGACQPPDPQPIAPGAQRGIDAVFADMDRPGVPGASVAVIRSGRMLYSRGYGSAQLEHGAPVTPRTPFHVASVSKQFTAMSVTMLASQGVLGLDDPVQRHLPWVPDLGRPVTVRQMIHHTSGIRDQWELLAMAGWRLDDVITTDQIRRLMERQRGLNFEPNAQYMYSNMGYTLLAQIVEAVSGSTFPEFTAENIFDPLGMERTHFHDDHEMVVPGRAYSYAPAEGGGFTKSVLSYANAGATSLFTTAEDLALWLDNFRHHEVGGEAVMAQMLTRGVLNDGDTIAYAHGLSTGEYRGLATLGHGGADAGFRSAVTWFPDQEVGIVVLTNVSNGNPQGRLFSVADVVLADAFPQDPQVEEAVAGHQEDVVEVSDAALEEAPGRYRTSIGPVITVEREERRLVVRIPDVPASDMVPRATAEFEVPDVGVSIRFAESWDSFDLISPEGEAVGTGERLPDVDLTQSLLDGYAGTYYSPELDALYNIRVEGGGLVAHHVRHGDIPLQPVLTDEFVSDRWFFGNVRFRRDPAGSVEGFDVSGGRVSNLRFLRLIQPLPN